jgi:hypothetical protein
MEATSEEATTTTRREGNFPYQQQIGGYNLPQPSTPRPNIREFTPTCFACDKLGKDLPVPRQEDRSYAARAPTPGGEPPQSTSRGRFTHMKKGKATNASTTAIEEF